MTFKPGRAAPSALAIAFGPALIARVSAFNRPEVAAREIEAISSDRGTPGAEGT